MWQYLMFFYIFQVLVYGQNIIFDKTWLFWRPFWRPFWKIGPNFPTHPKMRVYLNFSVHTHDKDPRKHYVINVLSRWHLAQSEAGLSSEVYYVCQLLSMDSCDSQNAHILWSSHTDVLSFVHFMYFWTINAWKKIERFITKTILILQ